MKGAYEISVVIHATEPNTKIVEGHGTEAQSKSQEQWLYGHHPSVVQIIKMAENTIAVI